MIASNFFDLLPEVYTDDSTDDSFGILCRKDNRRRICYIKAKYLQNNPYMKTYNVACPKSNGNGVCGEVLTSTEILKPGIGATDTFISIGCFETIIEAENMQKYIMTKFLRSLLGMKKVTQDNSKNAWSLIPVQDFTPSSDIDWTKSIPEIDRQLYAKYGLDESEIEFIETHVKEMT